MKSTSTIMVQMSPCQIEMACKSRGSKLIALGQHAVARLKVRADDAVSTKGIWWITRSVIHFGRREQTLSTVVRYINRAFAQASAKRNLHTFNPALQFLK